jgi:hypothetical protein
MVLGGEEDVVRQKTKKEMFSTMAVARWNCAIRAKLLLILMALNLNVTFLAKRVLEENFL